MGRPHGVRHLLTRYLWTDDSRWLLYLHDTDGHESWHLLRLDLVSAPPVGASGGRELVAGRR